VIQMIEKHMYTGQVDETSPLYVLKKKDPGIYAYINLVKHLL